MCRCHLMGRTDAWVSTPLSHWTWARWTELGFGATIRGALPRLETGIRSGLEVVPSARSPARLLATYARKESATNAKRPPPAGAIC